MVKNRLNIPIFLIFLGITLLFFHPITKGFVPFPGDLLLAEYQPWRSTSYNNIAAGGIPNKAQYFDTLRQLYPWKTVAINSIGAGIFPLWNPHDFSGAPLFANFQSAVLFPLNILYLLLPQIISWTILIILQPLLCLISVYLVARKYSLSRTASVFVSGSYAFCLYMTTFLQYNIMGHFMYLLPIGILTIEYLINGKKWAPILLICVMTASAFAGHLQLYGGVIAYLVLYFVIRLYQEKKSPRKKLIFIFIVFTLLSFGVSAVQLISGIELLSLSARASHASDFFFTNLLINPWQLILFFSPDLFGNPATKNYLLPYSYPSKALYIGLIALFFFSLSLFANKNKFFKAILIATIAIFLFITLNPISSVIFALNLPLISTGSPSNFIFMVSLGLCLLAGFGFDDFFRHPKKSLIIVGVFWMVVISTLFVTTVLKIPIVRNNLIYTSLVLFLLTNLILAARFNKLRKYIGVAIIIISLFDLFYFFHKFNPFVPQNYVYPPTQIGNWLSKNTQIDRTWGYSYANLQPNFSSQIGIYSVEGYDPLYPKHYGYLMQSSHDGILPTSTNSKSRSDATIAPGFGAENIGNNAFRSKILSISGVKYILDKKENGSTEQTFPKESFDSKAKVEDFTILTNKRSTPRFFLTNNYSIYRDEKDFAKQLFSKDYDETKFLLLDDDPDIKSSKPLSQSKTSLVTYLPNEVTIKTSADQNALLYLSDTYYPGWNVYVDGKQEKILKANYAYRAVVVPSGDHTVRFFYEPKSFMYGLVITLISILLSVIATIIYGKRKI